MIPRLLCSMAVVSALAVETGLPADRVLFFLIEREDLEWVPGRDTATTGMRRLREEIVDSLNEFRGEIVSMGSIEGPERVIGLAVAPESDPKEVRKRLESCKLGVKLLRVTGFVVEGPTPPGVSVPEHRPLLRGVHWDPTRRMILLIHEERGNMSGILGIGSRIKGTVAQEPFDLEVVGGGRQGLKDAIASALRGTPGVRLRSVDEKEGRCVVEMEMKNLEEMEGDRKTLERDFATLRPAIGRVLDRLKERGVEARLVPK